MYFLKKTVFEIKYRINDLCEFISLVILILFAILPGVILLRPSIYGNIFKIFGAIAVTVTCICIFARIICKFFEYKSDFNANLQLWYKSVVKIFKDNPHYVLLAVAYVFAVVSAFFASDRQRALWGTDFRVDGVFMYTVFASLFISGSFVRNSYLKKTLYAVYIVSFLLNALVAVQQYFGLIGSQYESHCPQWLEFLKNFYDKTGIRTGIFYKGVTGGFYNSNHVGYFILMSFMIISALLINSRNKLSFIFMIVLCAFSVYILILNDTFGCYIAAVLTLVLIVFIGICRRKHMKKNRLKMIFLPLIILIAVSILSLFMERNIVLKNFITLKNDVSKITSEEDDASKAGSGRWPLWIETVDMISEKPFFGYGPDNVNEEYKQRNLTMTRAHNEYLEHPLNCGIPYALFYFGGIFYIIIRRSRNMFTDNQAEKYLVPFMTCTAYMISAFTGVFLFYTACHFFIMLSLLKD